LISHNRQEAALLIVAASSLFVEFIGFWLKEKRGSVLIILFFVNWLELFLQVAVQLVKIP
jgi:hypothetical protein